MAQQTAVEFLGSYITTYLANHKKVLDIIEQAKAMEKEQIIKAASTVLWNNSSISIEQAEQYYNETYNK